jgi:hypothetical protein
MKKTILPVLGLVLFLFSQILSAQELQYPKTIIRYYDGSLILGEIVGEDEAEIQIRNEHFPAQLLVSKDKIRKIYRTDENVYIYKRGKFHHTRGKFSSFTIGFPIAPNPSFHIDLMVGRRLTDKYAVGFGTGIHMNDSYFRGLYAMNHFIPVYAHGRYYLGKGKARFYAFTKLGYGIAVRLGFSDEHSGGPMVQPGIGVVLASRKGKRYTFSLSNYIQHTKGNNTSFDLFNNPVEFDYSLWYNRVIFNFGFEFK